MKNKTMRTLVLSLILMSLIVGPYSVSKAAVSQVSGLAVQQTPTRWNNAADAAQGDNLTSGIMAAALYGYDNSSNTWRRIRMSNNAINVNITPTQNTLVAQGTPAAATAPWFVRLSDGSAASGTNANPIYTQPPQSSVFTICNDNTTGAHTEQALPFLTGKHTWTITVTGAPMATSISLQGSLDNSSWFSIDTSTTTTSEMRHIANKPVLYVRVFSTSLDNATDVEVKTIHGGN